MPSWTDRTVPQGREMLAIFGPSTWGPLHERHANNAAASKSSGNNQPQIGNPFFSGSGIAAGRMLGAGAAPQMLLLLPRPSALPSPLGIAARMVSRCPENRDVIPAAPTPAVVRCRPINPKRNGATIFSNEEADEN